MFFRVFSPEKLLISTSEYTLVDNLITNDALIEIGDINPEILKDNNYYKVKGKILNADGSVPTNYNDITIEIELHRKDGSITIVRPLPVVERDIKIRASGAVVKLDSNAFYHIEFLSDEKVNLKVKVLDNDSEILSSPLILNANQEEEINISINGEFIGKTEYSRLTEELRHIDLTGDLSNFDNSKFAVINNNIENFGKEIYSFIQAIHFKNKLQEIDNTISEEASEILYGILTIRSISGLNQLLLTPETDLIDTIVKAATENIINSKFVDNTTFIGANGDLTKILATTAQFSVINDDKLLYEAINLSITNDEYKKTFINLYINNREDELDFWSAVDDDVNLNKNELKCIIDIVEFANGNMSLISTLYSDINPTSGYLDISILAQKDVSWESFLIANNVTIPPGFEDVTASPSVSIYADYLARRVEKRYPSKVFEDKLKVAGYTWITTLLSNNELFKFGKKQIEEWVTTDLSTNQISEVKLFQRLYNMAPKYNKYDAMSKLIDASLADSDKIYSSTDITKHGREKFINKYITVYGGTENDAISIYKRAYHISITTLMTYAKYGKSFNTISSYMLGSFNFAGMNNADSDVPSLEELFGSLDSCACEHCQSVQSPSAYLVSLLQFSDDIKTGLDSKRGDISNLELSCKNTSTVLPYIDLVNEQLEEKVAGGVYSSFQTVGETDDLRVYPENINDNAYTIISSLIGARFPWSTPFNLRLEETRNYLNFFNTDRWSIMDGIKKSDGNDHTDYDKSCEYLKIASVERSLIEVEESNSTNILEYYNVTGLSELYIEGLNLLSIDILIEKADITFEQFKEVLQTKFVNKAENSILYDQNAPCTLCNAWIDITTENNQYHFLNRLHRFIRLWKKLDWEIKELDSLIVFYYPDQIENNTDITITDIFVNSIFSIDKLHQKYHHPVKRLLTWWYDHSYIDSDDNKQTFFEEILSNPAVFGPNVTLPNTYNLLTEEHRSIIQAAFKMTPADLANTIESSLLLNGETTIDEHELNVLFRVADFCNLLNISVQDLLNLFEVTKDASDNYINPFTNVVNSTTFIENLEFIKDSHLSIEELSYILIDKYDYKSNFVPGIKNIKSFFSQLFEEVRKIDRTYRLTETKKTNQEKLQFFINGNYSLNSIDTLIEIIDGESALHPSEQADYIRNRKYFFPGRENEIIDILIQGQANYIDPSTNDGKVQRYTQVLEVTLSDIPSSLAKLKLKTKLLLQEQLINEIFKIVSLDSIESEDIQSTLLGEQTDIFPIDPSSFNYLVDIDSGVYISDFDERFEWIINNNTIAVSDGLLTLTENLLADLLDKEDITNCVKILNNEISDETKRIDFFNNKFSFLDNLSDIISSLATNSSQLIKEDERFEFLVEIIINYHIKQYIFKSFSETFGVEIGIMKDILSRYTYTPDDITEHLIEYIIEKALDYDASKKEQQVNNNKGMNGGSTPPSFSYDLLPLIYRRIIKSTFIIRKYEIDRTDANLLFNNGIKNVFNGSTGSTASILGSGGITYWLEIYNLKLNGGICYSDNHFEDWKTFDLAYTYRDTYFNKNVSLLQFLDTDGSWIDGSPVSSTNIILTELSKITKWNVNELIELFGDGNLYSPTNFKKIEYLIDAYRIFGILNSVGGSVNRLLQWNVSEGLVNQNVADSVRLTAKEKYENKQWNEIA